MGHKGSAKFQEENKKYVLSSSDPFPDFLLWVLFIYLFFLPETYSLSFNT